MTRLLDLPLVLVLGGRHLADEHGVGIDGHYGRLAEGKTQPTIPLFTRSKAETIARGATGRHCLHKNIRVQQARQVQVLGGALSR